MPELRMTLLVGLHNQHRTQLYERVIETPWLPDSEDTLLLFGDLSWYVKDRYMDTDGSWTIELRGVIINPDDLTEQMFTNAPLDGATWRIWCPWRSEPEGEDFIGRLLEVGWKVWHS